MPSKPDRQTAVAERQHAPCCSWAVIISYLGSKPRQTSYYQYSTTLRWSPKQLMPFEKWGLTTVSTDFKRSLWGGNRLGLFHYITNGGGICCREGSHRWAKQVWTLAELEAVSREQLLITSLQAAPLEEKLVSELKEFFWESRSTQKYI